MTHIKINGITKYFDILPTHPLNGKSVFNNIGGSKSSCIYMKNILFYVTVQLNCPFPLAHPMALRLKHMLAIYMIQSVQMTHTGTVALTKYELAQFVDIVVHKAAFIEKLLR